jgi:hypothetical protein
MVNKSNFAYQAACEILQKQHGSIVSSTKAGWQKPFLASFSYLSKMDRASRLLSPL